MYPGYLIYQAERQFSDAERRAARGSAAALPVSGALQWRFSLARQPGIALRLGGKTCSNRCEARPSC